MAVSPTIFTERLQLMPFREDHLSERYVAWLNDKELMRYSEQRRKEHSLDSCRKYLESFMGTQNYFWAIEDVAGKLGHIGNLNAYVDEANLIADMGLLIGDARARGKGIGKEAWTAAVSFLLSLGLRKVSGGTMSANVPMLKIMKASGMIRDGVRTKHFLLENEPVDVEHWAAFRGLWTLPAGHTAKWERKK